MSILDPKIRVTPGTPWDAGLIRQARIVLEHHVEQALRFGRSVSTAKYRLPTGGTVVASVSFGQTYLTIDRPTAPIPPVAPASPQGYPLIALAGGLAGAPSYQPFARADALYGYSRWQSLPLGSVTTQIMEGGSFGSIFLTPISILLYGIVGAGQTLYAVLALPTLAEISAGTIPCPVEGWGWYGVPTFARISATVLCVGGPIVDSPVGEGQAALGIFDLGAQAYTSSFNLSELFPGGFPSFSTAGFFALPFLPSIHYIPSSDQVFFCSASQPQYWYAGAVNQTPVQVGAFEWNPTAAQTYYASGYFPNGPVFTPSGSLYAAYPHAYPSGSNPPSYFRFSTASLPAPALSQLFTSSVLTGFAGYVQPWDAILCDTPEMNPPWAAFNIAGNTLQQLPFTPNPALGGAQNPWYGTGRFASTRQGLYELTNSLHYVSLGAPPVPAPLWPGTTDSRVGSLVYSNGIGNFYVFTTDPFVIQQQFLY